MVEVDKMSMDLDISKDKLYTICNVLEGLRLMKMKGRNVYEWQGSEMLIPTMMMLKKMAEKEDMMGQLIMARKLVARSTMNDKQDAEKLNVVMTTQKVMMMFLVDQESTIISLDEMSIVIHGGDLTKLKRRLSIKRLNDICKILTGVGLLELEIESQDDENLYKYMGPEVPKIAIVESNEKVEGKMIEDVTGEMMEEITAVDNILKDGMEVVD